MVSENCNYILVMEMNGNLAVYADPSQLNRRRRRLLSSQQPSDWLTGWSSGTFIANETGTSIPLFNFHEDGSMTITEYKNGIHGTDTVELWTVNPAVNAETFVFNLAENGCLELIADGQQTIWSECSEWSSIATTDSSHSTQITVEADSALDSTTADTISSNDILIILIAVVIGILLCFIVVVVGYFVYIRRKDKRDDPEEVVIHMDATSVDARSLNLNGNAASATSASAMSASAASSNNQIEGPLHAMWPTGVSSSIISRGDTAGLQSENERPIENEERLQHLWSAASTESVDAVVHLAAAEMARASRTSGASSNLSGSGSEEMYENDHETSQGPISGGSSSNSSSSDVTSGCNAEESESEDIGAFLEHVDELLE